MGSLRVNERGVVTFQFLIVLVIVLFFILSFFGLSLTLANGSAVQYLTYSSARALSLGGESLQAQQSNAETKYNQLRQKFFKGNYTSSGEWFQVSTNPEVGFNQQYSDNSFRKMFYGVSASFSSTRTNFKIPFLTDKDDGGLRTNIASYLGREVSKEECETFNSERAAAICAIYGGAIGGEACANPPDTPGDNGC